MTTKLEKAFEHAEETIDSLKEEHRHLRAELKKAEAACNALRAENERLKAHGTRAAAATAGDSADLEEHRKWKHEREWRATRGLPPG